MPRKAKLCLIDSGHAKQPDFSIPMPGAERHDAVAQHYEEAARHRRQAAKLSSSALHEKASHHVYQPHHLPAEQQAEQDGKTHVKNHLGDSHVEITFVESLRRKSGRKEMISTLKDQVEGKLHKIKCDT